MNFIPILMTQKAYFKSQQTQLPLVWIYYGLMMIMMVYNLFIFFASRDRSYALYVIFILMYILFQMTLNGYSFQYLWPDATWWACNALPFFMCMAIFFAAVFIRDVIESRHLLRNLDNIYLFFILPVSFAWGIASLLVKYSLAIRVATVIIGLLAALQFVMIMAAMIKKSRAACFIALGFGGRCSDHALCPENVRVLPEMFITEWGYRSDPPHGRVHVAGPRGQDQRHEKGAQDPAYRAAGERARGRGARGVPRRVVQTATILTEESLRASDQLQRLQTGFPTFHGAGVDKRGNVFNLRGAVATVETIYQSTMRQKDEGEKSKTLVEDLNIAQKGLIRESQKVEETIRKILESTGSTADSLQKMTDTMHVINAGGKEITTFIAHDRRHLGPYQFIKPERSDRSGPCEASTGGLLPLLRTRSGSWPGRPPTTRGRYRSRYQDHNGHRVRHEHRYRHRNRLM